MQRIDTEKSNMKFYFSISGFVIFISAQYKKFTFFQDPLFFSSLLHYDCFQLYQSVTVIIFDQQNPNFKLLVAVKCIFSKINTYPAYIPFYPINDHYYELIFGQRTFSPYKINKFFISQHLFAL